MTDNISANASIEELRESALKHYEEASASINCWSSFVSNAIKAYNPEWENEYSKLRKEFAELQGDNLILLGKIKQLESDIDNYFDYNS